jgi:hypothetical protein
VYSHDNLYGPSSEGPSHNGCASLKLGVLATDERLLSTQCPLNSNGCRAITLRDQTYAESIELKKENLDPGWSRGLEFHGRKLGYNLRMTSRASRLAIEPARSADPLRINSQSRPGDLILTCRRTRSGPERDLVDAFLEKLNIRLPKGHRMTLFEEPRLESGYPDIVMVIWCTATAEKWSTARFHLTSVDLRLLHFISTRGMHTKAEIRVLFGPRILASLDRLEEAEVLRVRGNQIHPRPLSKLYAVRQILAVEAKVQEWKEALAQASLNRWFATSSYILLPKVPQGTVLMAQAESMGIGVWSAHDARIDARCLPASAAPVSYASWLFNECAWRAGATGRGQLAEPELG